jgi:hypothetical protein
LEFRWGNFAISKYPTQKCGFLFFGRNRYGARGSASFHILENEQKWWGNFYISNLPTLFCGLAALIRPDFQKIAFFAGSMPHKRWNLGGEISLFQNTPHKNADSCFLRSMRGELSPGRLDPAF